MSGEPILRAEFDAHMALIETKLKIMEVSIHRWVLSGIIAALLTFGATGAAIYNKVDSLTPLIEIVDERGRWMEDQELMDREQNRGISEANPKWVAPEVPERPR